MCCLPISPSVFVFCTASFTLLFLLYRIALPRPIPGIPHNKNAANSILGDAPEFLKYVKENEDQALVWWQQQLEKHKSPIIQLFLRPFRRPLVVVADFRETKDILLRRSKEFDRGTFFEDLFRGTLPNVHVWQKTTEKVKAQKRLWADAMLPPFLHEVAAPHIHEAALDMVRLWNLKTDLARGHAFEAHQDIAHATLDAIWVVALGSHAKTIHSQANMLESIHQIQLPSSIDTPAEFPKAPHPPAFDAVLTMTKAIEPLISSPFPHLHHWFLRQQKSYKVAKKYKDQEIDIMMKQAAEKFSNQDVNVLEDQGKDRSALDHMIRREILASKKEGREPRYDTPMAREEVFGMLVAGFETNSTAVAWGVKFLSDHQEVQHKLRAALRSTYANATAEKRQPLAKEVMTLQHAYIDATLEEILRCGQTAAAHGRTTTVDAELFGNILPKGTDVVFLTHATYVAPPVGTVDETKRSSTSQASKEKSWGNQDIGAFKPERWLHKSGEDGEVEFQKNSGPSMPFGLGIRSCYGLRLAQIELRMLIVFIIWNFELLPAPKELSTYTAVDRVTHQPQKCYLRLKKAEW